MRAEGLNKLTVVGGGPAGASAAISACLEGSQVAIHEKSKFPRHKVCGEFLSPEIAPMLEKLGVAGRFAAAGPARIRRMSFLFGSKRKTAVLPEPAYGLSRYAFDDLLLTRAAECGVRVECHAMETIDPPAIVARGRRAIGRKEQGLRIFGFKAHFCGPADDAIELHFFEQGYIGINQVEGGITNVCGLAGEGLLRRIGFQYDDLIDSVPSLRERLSPLRRSMQWMSTGPLVYENAFAKPAKAGIYLAGDALSFVDPFTGSGMCSAVLSGLIAGRFGARGLPTEEHLRACREALGRPFAFASFFRIAIVAGWAEHLLPIVPAVWLYRLTRPRYSNFTISS